MSSTKYKDSQIVSITDIIEQKVRKEQELERYEEQLTVLIRKKFWIQKEIQMAVLLFKQSVMK